MLAATLLPVWAQQSDDAETECEEDPHCEVVTVTARRPDTSRRSAASGRYGDGCPACTAGGGADNGNSGAGRTARNEEEGEEEEEEFDCRGLQATMDQAYTRCMGRADVDWGNCRSKAAEGGPMGALLDWLLGICDRRQDNDEQECLNNWNSFNTNSPPHCHRSPP